MNTRELALLDARAAKLEKQIKRLKNRFDSLEAEDTMVRLSNVRSWMFDTKPQTVTSLEPRIQRALPRATF